MNHICLERPCEIAELAEGDHLLEVPSLATARQLLGPQDAAARIARGRLFWSAPQMRSRSRLRLGMHDRGEAYFIADADIDLRDASGHRRHLPLHLKVIKRRALRLAPGEILDVTASHLDWPGLHPREELYVLLHVDRLSVGHGAVIRIAGNVLVVNCGQLVLDPPLWAEADGPHLDIRILGTGHAAFSRARRVAAMTGRPGPDGPAGRDGAPSIMSPTIFGTLPVQPATCGADGEPGGDGRCGTSGQPGGMAMLADLRFATIADGLPSRCIRVFAQAGQGHAGGPGGDGGRGGRGGNSEIRPGSGGSGGHGGRGGNGGHGGLSSNVFIAAAERHRHLFDLCGRASLGGAAGPGGRGGRGGPGGAGPAGLGATGGDGADGADGLPGRGRSAPGMYFIPNRPADVTDGPSFPTPREGVPTLA